MFITRILTILALSALAAPSFAQQVVPAQAAPNQEEVDCEDEKNQDDEACLGLPIPGVPITNFVPLVGGVVGAAAVAGFAGGGGSSPSTPNTPSTPSTPSTTSTN